MAVIQSGLKPDYDAPTFWSLILIPQSIIYFPLRRPSNATYSLAALVALNLINLWRLVKEEFISIAERPGLPNRDDAEA